jgi:hypothetical protein
MLIPEIQLVKVSIFQGAGAFLMLVRRPSSLLLRYLVHYLLWNPTHRLAPIEGITSRTSREQTNLSAVSLRQ